MTSKVSKTIDDIKKLGIALEQYAIYSYKPSKHISLLDTASEIQELADKLKKQLKDN